VLTGPKTDGQKFPGAVYTLCIEAMMQDRKALQAGTSHFLGQNFAKAFDVKFQSQAGQLEHAWATSWGVSTRLIGGLIMTHSDDSGLVCPPRLAPIHVVIVPLGKSDEERANSVKAAETLKDEIVRIPREEYFGYEPFVVEIDRRFNQAPGSRFIDWEIKGVPIRIELGPRDLAQGTCVMARRDFPGKEGKQVGIALAEVPDRVTLLLKEIQKNLFERAKKYRDANSFEVNSYDEFKQKIEEPGGFLWAHWDGTPETEERISTETKATIRCIPFSRAKETGKCMVTGKESAGRVVFAKAY
jgi:prolyl-tRNA synthetase